MREIASGGFGRVYLTKVLHADGFSRLAAVKVLHPKWMQNTEIASRMRDEARLLGMLRHKNIVDVFDLTRIDGRAAVVMEYLEAVDTKVLVSEHRRAGQRLPLRSVLQIGADVASALDAAYNRPPYAGEKPLRVIHRDIKPSNIMVDGSGVTKVLDFGVARAEFDTREARTQEMSFGSSEYMAPERLFFEPDTPSSDVYSLGATLYELLALQKLGKAKLRATKQETWFEERFEDLLERYPMASEEQEDLVHDMLYDMLAFEESSRPTAADCVTRLRSLARACDQAGLDEWAESVIPALVQKYETKELRRKEGESTSLVDRVVTEDKRGFAPETPESDEDPSAAFDELKAQSLASMSGKGVQAEPEGWAKEDSLSRMESTGTELSLGLPLLTAETSEVPASIPPPVPDVLARAASGPLSTDGLREPDALAPSQIHTMEMPIQDAMELGFEDEPPTEVGGAALLASLNQQSSEVDVTLDTATGPTDLPLLEQAEGAPNIPRHRPPAATPVIPPPTSETPPLPQFDEGPKSGMGMIPIVMMVVSVVGLLLAVLAMAGFGLVWFGTDVLHDPARPEVDLVSPSEEVIEARVDELPDSTGGSASEERPLADEIEPVASAPEGGTTFTSAIGDTKKMVVRCDSGSESGTESVTISDPEPGTCTVSRIGQDRSRQQTVVPNTEEGSYICFADGQKSCEPV